MYLLENTFPALRLLLGKRGYGHHCYLRDGGYKKKGREKGK
jgi:hypothetical protein